MRSSRAVVVRFIVYFVGTLVLLAAVAIPLGAQERRRLVAEAVANEQGQFDTVEEFIHQQLFSLVREVRSLARVRDLEVTMRTITPSTRQLLAEFLRSLADSLVHYAQLRVLSPNGMELVRVDYRDGEARATPIRDLQDKSDRYYVAGTLALEPGQVFVSNLDLNAERGEIEVPLHPTLRVSTLVADDRGEILGLVVLNYEARRLLDGVVERQAPSNDRAPAPVELLVNADGYFLVGPSPDDAWGWLLDRPDATLDRSYPAIAARVAEAPEGSLRVGPDVVVWKQIEPLERTSASVLGAVPSTAAGAQDGWMRTPWTLVSIVPMASILEASPLRQPLGRIMVAIWIALAGIASLAVAIAQAERSAFRHQAELDRREIYDLYENAPVGYHSMDAEGTVVRINRTQLQWLGFDREEVVGKKTLIDLVAETSAPAAEQYLADLRTGHESHDVQLLLQRKDGSRFPVAMNSTVRRDSSGAFAVARTSTIDVRERRRLEEALLRRANTDALTGVLNRRSFTETGAVRIAEARADAQPVGLLALDIDHFKSINDRFGHAGGDQALTTFTRVVARQLRGRDVLARIGGEEFAVLLPGAPPDVAERVGERVRAAVEASVLTVDVAGVSTDVRMTCSVGVAALEGVRDTLDLLLARADRALYAAKEQGRNRVERA